MCGRFTLRTPATVLIEHFDLDVRGDRQMPLFEARYNIAPTQDILVVRADPIDGLRRADMMRWGLIPSWSKDAKGVSGPPMINARAETLASKPMFRSAMRHRRCLVPADGFYEWQQTTGGGHRKKQPYFIHRPDHEPFAFAGLWEIWKQPTGQSSSEPLMIESCTIVTTEANAALRELHERMPVILAPSDYGNWLDPAEEDSAHLQYLLSPCPHDELVADPVGDRVNRVANDDIQCITVQHRLFD
ncbi:MAG TPA: SOS response-associated peptidase [Lacipirellulaceae bacterium]|nr:SOS response-associated peptidase [Lacipirellulaceae bacterium]